MKYEAHGVTYYTYIGKCCREYVLVYGAYIGRCAYCGERPRFWKEDE